VVKKENNMERSILKTVFYFLTALLAVLVWGCEEEQNKLPDFTVYVSPREDVGATQGDIVNIKVTATDVDGTVAEIKVFIDGQMVSIKSSADRLIYNWNTDYIDVKDYTIKVEVSDNENGLSTQEVIYTIHGALPTVNFGANLTNQLAGLAIEFTDSSTYTPTSWLWDFGDGNTSTDQNPTHIYTTGGLYTVSLTATNAYGSETETKTAYITVVDTFVTDYDNNTYKVVKIGEQYWMAENLKTTHYADGTPMINGVGIGNTQENYFTKYYFTYNDDETTVDVYGRLYNWSAAMDGAQSSNSNPSGVQGACPDHWHLPSSVEWNELFGFLGGKGISGGKLKATGYDFWNYPNTAASNESGFTALPSGQRTEYGYFIEQGTNSFYWTTSEGDSYVPNGVVLYHDDSKVSLFDYIFSGRGYSIRCVRDSQ